MGRRGSALNKLWVAWQQIAETDIETTFRRREETAVSRRLANALGWEMDLTLFFPGAWSKEEEDELMAIIQEMQARGQKQDEEIFWGRVSQRMGGKRGKQQCRIKWCVSLDHSSLRYLTIQSVPGRIN
jgi:hypothetical protein